MGDLLKSFAKAKLGSLPPELVHQEEQEDDQGDSSSASSMSSTGTVVPSPGHKPAPTLPLPWSEFFARELYLEKQGEGYSAKYHVYVTPPATPKDPLLVLHHGAGSSGLSWSLFAVELKRLLPEAGLLALDARDHGSTVWDSSGVASADLSLSALTQDMVDMINLTASKFSWPKLPRLLLVGHSLGGAVVVNAAKSDLLGTNVLGYSVLDVVEGSAIDALQHMQKYLASRPSSFESLDRAIEWHVRSRTLRNPASAKASVPALLVPAEGSRWVWKTDLAATEAYWKDWFGGMSGKFLSARGAKLLLLAGTDRLDKELMIGQMQGELWNFYSLRSNVDDVLTQNTHRQVPAASFPVGWSLHP
jgi:protein phosphatase methylesterase 1